MRRVEADWTWSLFDPKDVPELPDLCGEEFDAAYREAEAEGRYERQVPARDLYGRMMRTLAQTGNGWMTFKDASNRQVQPDRAARQRRAPVQPVHRDPRGHQPTGRPRSATSARSTSPRHLRRRRASTATRLRATVAHRGAVPRPGDRHQLLPDRARPAASNPRWRPVGLGLMGLQDVFFTLRLPFDSAAARELSTRITEEIYFTALETSADLAEQHGAHPAFAETRAAQGQLQFDLWGVTPTQTARWDALRERIAAHGLRNSLLIAIAPTATIASIAGCYECIEPQVSNLFKRETLSGEFLQINALPGARAEGPRPVDRRRSATRSSGPTARCRASTTCRPRSASCLPHRVGAAAAGAHRPGRRPRRRSSTRASR